MAGNSDLKQAILKVVSNQLRMRKPPETRETLDRLISEGYSERQAKDLIGEIVAIHIYEMLRDKRYFDESQYVADLKRLPRLPWQE